MPARAPEMLGELLLELQSEEIPARMQQRAAEDLARLVLDGLKKAGLAVEGHEAYVTPRRLALVVKGLPRRSEEHTSALQSLMRISYAVFCLKKKKQTQMSNDTTAS